MLFAFKFSYFPTSAIISPIVDAILCGSLGSKNIAASPATSGRLDVLLQATGIPHDMASMMGSPKPSYSDGCTKTVAPLYRAGKCSSRTPPVNIT